MMSKLKTWQLVPLLAPMAFAEEVAYRWGAFSGWTTLLALASVTGPWAAAAAGALSIGAFAKAHGGATNMDRFIGLVISGAVFTSIFALGGGLLWATVAHLFFNIAGFGIPKLLNAALNPILRRKGAAEIRKNAARP